MTGEQFSNQFDTQISAFLSKIPFGEQAEGMSIAFDEYEKSVFLTKAQEELVISFYTGKNAYGDSFEKTEEMRRYLADLVVEAELTNITNNSGNPIAIAGSDSNFFSLKEGSPAVWYIVYEAVQLSNAEANGCHASTTLEVVPVRHDEYNRLRKNPFRGANGRRALRLDLSDGVIEIVCKYDVEKYYLRYLRKPTPIVLVDGIEVSGKDTKSEPACELHEALHQKILDRAVMLALQSRGYRVNNNRE
jgi:hypothetical protein